MSDRQRPCRHIAALLALLAAAATARAEKPQDTGSAERSFLYVAVPGIRNYVEYGGIGLLVFDRDDGYRFDQAHSHLDRPERRAARERQGHRRQRT